MKQILNRLAMLLLAVVAGLVPVQAAASTTHAPRTNSSHVRLERVRAHHHHRGHHGGRHHSRHAHHAV